MPIQLFHGKPVTPFRRFETGRPSPGRYFEIVFDLASGQSDWRDMTLQASDWLVVFSVDEQQLALPVSTVERVLRAAEITPLPGAPTAVLGVLNLQGKIIPIFDLHGRLGLPARPLRSSDHFMIIKTSRRTVGLAIDSASEVVQSSAELRVDLEEIVSGVKGIESVLQKDGKIVLIQNVEAFLSMEEERTLAQALEG